MKFSCKWRLSQYFNKEKITSLQFRIFLLWMPVVHYLFFPLKVMAVKTVLFAIKLMHFWACLWQHFMSMVKYQGCDRRHLIFSKLQYLQKSFMQIKHFFFFFKLCTKVSRDGETVGVKHMTHFIWEHVNCASTFSRWYQFLSPLPKDF